METGKVEVQLPEQVLAYHRAVDTLLERRGVNLLNSPMTHVAYGAAFRESVGEELWPQMQTLIDKLSAVQFVPGMRVELRCPHKSLVMIDVELPLVANNKAGCVWMKLTESCPVELEFPYYNVFRSMIDRMLLKYPLLLGVPSAEEILDD